MWRAGVQHSALPAAVDATMRDEPALQQEASYEKPDACSADMCAYVSWAASTLREQRAQENAAGAYANRWCHGQRHR